MIKKLTFLLFFLPHLAFSQTATDDNISLSYVTYAQGHIVVSLQNKTAGCNIEVRLKWGADRDTSITLSGSEMRQVMLPFAGGSTALQAKTVKSCNLQSNGPWISVSLLALPLRNQERQSRSEKAALPGRVKVVAINGSWWKEMSETEFQAHRQQYRTYYFILRNGRPKEVIL